MTMQEKYFSLRDALEECRAQLGDLIRDTGQANASDARAYYNACIALGDDPAPTLHGTDFEYLLTEDQD